MFLVDAAALFADGALEMAEKKYIEAVRLDPKSKDAYRGLGDVYLRQGHIAEAKETYAFVAQLDPNDDYVFIKLSELAEQEGDIGTEGGAYMYVLPDVLLFYPGEGACHNVVDVC